MSGENRAERNTPPDSTRARAAQANPSRGAGTPPPLPVEPLAALPPANPPPAKAKKPKPPPGMITAGGVDMARGHAENIQPKGPGAALTPAVPKVVLSVETDTRRVPTAPRLIAGGKSESERPPAAAADTASPWVTAAVEVVDKRDLPSANLPVAPPPVAPVKPKSGGWLRFAVVLMLLLLSAGIVRRVRMATSRPETSDAPQRTFAQAPPLPPEATAEPTATAAARPRALAAPASTEVDPTAPVADPTADPSAEAAVEAAPDPALSVIAPRPRLAPPPPKPTFKPLFELPQEKAKETP